MYYLQRLRGESMAKTVSQLKAKTAMSALIVREENLAELEESIKELNSSLTEGELVELANINSVSVIIKYFQVKTYSRNFDET